MMRIYKNPENFPDPIDYQLTWLIQSKTTELWSNHEESPIKKFDDKLMAFQELFFTLQLNFIFTLGIELKKRENLQFSDLKIVAIKSTFIKSQKK